MVLIIYCFSAFQAQGKDKQLNFFKHAVLHAHFSAALKQSIDVMLFYVVALFCLVSAMICAV